LIFATEAGVEIVNGELVLPERARGLQGCIPAKHARPEGGITGAERAERSDALQRAAKTREPWEAIIVAVPVEAEGFAE